MDLSLVITAKNEEKDLPSCLDSVKDLASEIIFVDDNSTDKTREIAEKYNAKIFIRTFDNYSNQKNYALKQASGKWILHLDPDEKLTPELAREIKQVISDANQT
ncbi:MAG TPA: glycosyltransferase family 2 protein, partial [Elusimicrobiales bacterium]|nr:glycosyltransferase family 2 protein [Elusimicrobiales bacterium]